MWLSKQVILKKKRTDKENLLLNYNFKNKNYPLWLIILEDNLINNKLIDTLSILPSNFLICTHKKLEEIENVKLLNIWIDSFWFDFLVNDNYEDNFINFLRKWIIPIVLEKHYISSLLKEFNAKNIEWNAFIFSNSNIFEIFYAIIRFLENYKFPYDHKALVKNVLDIW